MKIDGTGMKLMVFSTEGKQLASTSVDGKIKIWDAVQAVYGHQLAAAFRRDTVKVWDVQISALIPTDRVSSLVYHLPIPRH